MPKEKLRTIAYCWVLKNSELISKILQFPGVLVLAGIELIFFLVAGIVLCFGFRKRIMLITY